MSGFWKGKKVLVTGAHGFVGANLVPELRKKKPKKVLTPSRHELDLIIQEDVFNYFAEKAPDVVIHLAGRVGGIGINKQKPAEFFNENVMMSVLVTHHSWLCGADKLVSLAAGCGYPAELKCPFSEEDFWAGLPDMNSYGYSMAKKNLIIQSWAYREQYGFDSSVLLPANLYGPHDNFDLETSHVVPALVRKFIGAKERGLPEVEVWGDGSAVREFLFVTDAVKAILDIAERYNETGPLNLGTGQETTIYGLAHAIRGIVGYEGDIIWLKEKPNGQYRRRYDMSKFKEAMGYVPSTSLVEGVTKTVNWYKVNYIHGY